MRPNTIYGVSKVAAELLSDYYFQRFGVDARGGECVAVEVDAFFEIAALGDRSVARDGAVTDVGQLYRQVG